MNADAMESLLDIQLREYPCLQHLSKQLINTRDRVGIVTGQTIQFPVVDAESQLAIRLLYE